MLSVEQIEGAILSHKAYKKLVLLTRVEAVLLLDEFFRRVRVSYGFLLKVRSCTHGWRFMNEKLISLDIRSVVRVV